MVRQHTGPPIGLVITDVVMPGMNGKLVAEAIRALRPHVRVLFTSGYTENVIVHHGVLDAGIDFLGKPYSPYELGRRVHEAIGKH